ncbi:MAG TPA: Hpt domain-containing protein, partial [Spirochaetia bacterium]|nr:Hpt domain-containing protein [Spirochaetia bacterium]
MDIDAPGGGFSLESLGEDPGESARAQLAGLEKSLESCGEAAEVAALVDEVYRAAHSLKSAVDPMRLPNVDRLARRIQDVVRQARSGAIPVTLELGAVLASIARVARAALDDPQGPEPLSASSAAATLEEMLEHPATWSAPPGFLGRPFSWSRVEAGRLDAAGDAARSARSAFSAFQKAAEESADVVGRFRAALSEHQRALEALREVIPRAMGAAARGEPTASAAAELGETVSR